MTRPIVARSVMFLYENLLLFPSPDEDPYSIRSLNPMKGEVPIVFHFLKNVLTLRWG